MMGNGHDVDQKVNQAFSLLNQVVHDKKEYFYKFMRHQADDASGYVDRFAGYIKNWIYEVEAQTEKTIRDGESIISKNSEEAFKKVEKEISEHPWKAMGLVALTAFIIGYSLPPDDKKNGK